MTIATDCKKYALFLSENTNKNITPIWRSTEKDDFPTSIKNSKALNKRYVTKWTSTKRTRTTRWLESNFMND